jgi:hypothetical protein
LPSRIERVWYVNPYGQEIRLNPNTKVLDALKAAQCIIYSIGSLYTSIIPSLIIRGVGEAVASNNIKHKILILNSTLDRETGPSFNPLTATDFIAAIARACAYSRGFVGPVGPHEYKLYVTHLIHLSSPITPKVDRSELQGLGIECIRLYGRSVEGTSGLVRYDERALVQALEATIGMGVSLNERSRRNTLES